LTEQNTRENWEGHKPATSATLLDVITTATTGSAKVSRSAKALFTACEFWAAARNGGLVAQLADDAIAQLRAAEASFTVVGLLNTAHLLHEARILLAQSTPPSPLAVIVRALEKSLATSQEPVDQRLADFADLLARDR